MNDAHMRYKFSHVGVPDLSVPDSAEYVRELDIYRFDGSMDEMHFEYTRFPEMGRLPEALKHEIHIGYEVKDLENAMQEADTILMAPFALANGRRIAMIRRRGVLVELIEEKSGSVESE